MEGTRIERKESVLAPGPTPKLEDHHLSAVHDCLFNIFAATLHIGGRSSIRKLKTRHAVVTGTHLSRHRAVTLPQLYALMEWRGATLPFLPRSYHCISLCTSKSTDRPSRFCQARCWLWFFFQLVLFLYRGRVA
jgi:hypothetical protein